MNVTELLLAKVEAQQGGRELWCAAAIVGLAVDLGAVSLADAQALVSGAWSYDELANRLTTLAEDARALVDDPLPIGYPPAPAGRFRIVGEREEVPTWTR